MFKIKKLLSIGHSLLKVNLIKTISFNLRMFDLKTAIHLPILFYGRCDILAKGEVVLNVKPRFGVLKIGENQSLTFGVRGSHREVSYFCLNGSLIINGYNNYFANGCKIYIKKRGKLTLNGDILLQNLSKIHCANSIAIGRYCSISWETQIFDTNMHYMIDANGVVKNNKGTIAIGDNCWIGNRCTIQKGTVLPDHSVVASNSLVNSDYSLQPSGIIAGTPARHIRTGYKRLLDNQTERLLDKFFRNNPTETAVSLSDL